MKNIVEFEDRIVKYLNWKKTEHKKEYLEHGITQNELLKLRKILETEEFESDSEIFNGNLNCNDYDLE
jgi:hypothetical protein